MRRRESPISRWIMNRNQSNTHATTIGLTALGQQKAEAFEGLGLRGYVMSVLAENGPSTLSEIHSQLQSRGIACEYPKLKAVIRWLIRAGYARPVGADGMARPSLVEA